MKFTNEQLAVIHHSDSHARVTAVAGSGKTATLIGRILHLIEEKGVEPHKILVLMFNKSAAEEFSVRLEAKLAADQPKPRVSTFHAMGLAIYKRLAENGQIPMLRLGKTFQSTQLATQALSIVQGKSIYTVDKNEVELLEMFIGLVKSSNQSPSVIYDEMDSTLKSKSILKAFDQFEAARKQLGLFFYSDMLFTPVKHLIDNPEAQQGFSGLYEHVLVDEYQDINDIQQDLVRVIAGKTASVLAVGDADQCIYEWRGAKPGYLLNKFEQDFPNAKSYTLSHTFRYGHALALAANNVITRNKERDNHLVVANPAAPNTETRRVEYKNYNDVYSAILSQVNAHQRAGKPLSQLAIVARLYSSLAQPELALLQMGIPYRVEGANSVVESEVTKFLTSCMMIASEEINTLSDAEYYNCVSNFLTFPRTGLTQREVSDLSNAVLKSGRKLDVTLNKAAQNIKPYPARKIRERALLIHAFNSRKAEDKAFQLMEKIDACLSLKSVIREQAPNALRADEQTSLWSTLQEIAKAKNFTPIEFAQELDSAASLAGLNESQQEPDAVVLMSAHRAKGLEWETVIIPNLEKSKFPYQHHDATLDNTESERRLFYVAMTRARRNLILLTPKDALFDFTDQGLENDKAIFTASRFAHEAALPFAANGAQTINSPSDKQNAAATHVENVLQKYKSAVRMN